MDIDRNAKIIANGSVEVSATPAEVWTILSDIDGWASWNSDVREAKLLGDLAPGSRFTWRAGPGTITSVLRSVEPGRELGWTGSTMGIRAIHVWRLEGTPGGTRVTTEESWAGWPTRLMPKRMERMLRHAIFDGLYALKSEVEFRLRRDLRLAA